MAAGGDPAELLFRLYPGALGSLVKRREFC
jgi:hypothetical protein